MNLTDIRFWNWRTLIVVLIISLLIAIVVFFKRCMTTDTADIERVGNEIIGMIDGFQCVNNRLPVDLNELGSPFTDRNETYEYRGYLFYYEPTKDGQYWLTVTLGPDENYSYYSRRKYWIWDYDNNLTAEKQEELFMEVFQSYKSVWKYDSLRANTDSINTIYPSAPDSLIYCRQYYEDGKLAAEGWMLHDWNREGDYTDNIGTWKYYTRDGIMIEKQWPLKQWPLK